MQSNSKAFAAALAAHGFRIVTGGTDNHLFMVDLRPKHITGKEAAVLLDRVQITVNKNLVPFDPQPPTEDIFDLVPAAMIDRVVTEEGAAHTGDVAALIDRTPCLTQGYDLLRGRRSELRPLEGA